MTRHSAIIAGIALLTAGAAAAAPRVATDIAPVHSLAARVMQGVGEPTLILPPGASPHSHALRPSEAAALAEADVVFWVGEALAPWLERAIDSLAERATVVELAEVEGLVRLPIREDARFEPHDHGDDHAEVGHGQSHGHGHSQGHSHGHGHAHGHAHGHGHSHDRAHADHDDDDDDHAHGAFDAHLWLDPTNAAIWLDAMAAALSRADPANAAAYAANAAAGRAEIDALTREIAARVAPARGKGYIVFHDAYQYFEARFDLPASGAVSLSDAREPSARRVAEVRGRIEADEVACVFSEPQFSPALVATLTEGTGVRSAVLDPLGAGLAPGAGLYPRLMRDLAAGLAGCLQPGA